MMEVLTKQTRKFTTDLKPGDRIRIGIKRQVVTVDSVAQRAWGKVAVAYVKENGRTGRRAFQSRAVFRMVD
jgi:hypothetical protein